MCASKTWLLRGLEGGWTGLCLIGLFSLTPAYDKSKEEAKESCPVVLRKMHFLFPVWSTKLVFGPGCSISSMVTRAMALSSCLFPSRHPARSRVLGSRPPAQLRSCQQARTAPLFKW